VQQTKKLKTISYSIRNEQNSAKANGLIKNISAESSKDEMVCFILLSEYQWI